MNTPVLIAIGIGVFVALAIILRLLFAGSQVAGATALGRLPQLPKSWRHWLLGERDHTA